MTYLPTLAQERKKKEHERTTIKIDIVHANIKDHDRNERILTNQDRVPPVTVGHVELCSILVYAMHTPSFCNDLESSVHTIQYYDTSLF